MRWLLSASTIALAFLGGSAVADAYPEVFQTANQQHDRLNPTGYDIPLGGPLSDGEYVLGEVTYTLKADDRILVDIDPLRLVIADVISAEALAAFDAATANRAQIYASELATAGFPLAYDPRSFGLILTIDPAARPRQAISIAGVRSRNSANVAVPADLSGYLTAFISSDYVHKATGGQSTGFETPSFLLDSAIRYRGFVLENEATLGDDFRREGTRLVFDDLDRTARWTAGDLEPVSRGFSGAAPLAGLSVVRTYSDLEPQRNVQPRGQQSFTLSRSATVETFVNGQSVQQTRLNPGTYDVRDFPFAQGANDVRLVIRDDAGIESVVSFSINFDRSLLDQGLSEFGLFLGTETDFADDGIQYSDTMGASGFYRRGVTDEITAGGNFQLNENGGVVGAEGVWASPIGTLGGDLAISRVAGSGEGYALNLSLERSFGSRSNALRTLSATFQTVSENFSTPSQLAPNNPFAFEVGVTYSQALTSSQYVSTDVFYSAGRDSQADQMTLRGVYGWRVNPRTQFNVEGIYEDRRGSEEFGVRLSLTYRLSQFSSVNAEVDTRRDRSRLGYQTSRGRGVESWTATADLQRTETSTGVNASYTRVANRAELGATHQTSFAADGGDITDQRTSVRMGTSIAFADGTFAVSRPIYDSFAIVKAHKSLKGADLYVEPREEFYTSRSDFFGPAVASEIGAYSPRLLTFDVPDAPIGYDIGPGSANLLPPYRSGYLITVGSDYFVSASGQFVNSAGQPASLIVGLAYEVALPDRAPVRLFSNSAGRFAVQGLRPGRWRVETSPDSPTVYLLDIPDSADGLVRLGTIRPEPRQ